MNWKAALVLGAGDDAWRNANLAWGFSNIARQLLNAGVAVELILPPGAAETGVDHALGGLVARRLSYADPPIISGSGPAAFTASLRAGHQLWRHLSGDPPDIVLAPVTGGLLQPSLVSRAMGESLAATSIVLWDDFSTAERVKLGDIEPPGFAALVDDALETTALRLADAVIGPRASGWDGRKDLRHVTLTLPERDESKEKPATSDRIREIVFVGPASARHGTAVCLDAVEELDRVGELLDVRVTFLGPWRDGPRGLGKAMLGRRARAWNCKFTQLDESRIDNILAYLGRPGVLAVFAGMLADDDSLVVETASAGLNFAICDHHPLAERMRGVAEILATDMSDLPRVLTQGRSERCIVAPCADDWPAALGALVDERRHAPVRQRELRPSVALCITHRDRLESLTTALQSRNDVDANTEVVVVDTGSAPETLALLGQLEGEQVSVLHAPRGARQSVARNLAARETVGDILVFLDDDNVFVEDGLRRIVEPLYNADFDIVVSNLALYDETPRFDGQLAAAHLVFLGEADWAGLVFNGFGDANFAMRRESFVLAGGFEEDDAAAFDWVFFSRARALGLKIGVLQRPAIGYHRELSGRDSKWKRQDFEGPRRRMLEMYAATRASPVILGIVQHLGLPILE